MEKISVIVPVYNVEKYINKCVDSIINQTYKNLEIILIDDGSPDRSGEICDEYAKKDSRIKVIHKENGGLSDARNAGIEKATGEYLMFIDSDDYIDEKMAESLYNAVKSDKSDMAICSFEYVDESYQSIKDRNIYSPIQDGVFSKREILEKLCESYFWYYVVAVNKIYNKKLFCNIRFPKGKLHEDEFVVHKIVNLCDRISCISQPFYKYLQRDGSIMHAEFNAERIAVIDAYIERTELLLTNVSEELAARCASITREQYKNILEGSKASRAECQKEIDRIKPQLRAMYKKLVLSPISLKRRLFLLLCYIDVQHEGFLDNVLKNASKFKQLKLFEMLLKVKNKIKMYAKKLIICAKLKRKIKKTRKKGPCVFLMATPCHDNLGDHAIVKAEYKLLDECGLSKNIVEISNNSYHTAKKELRKMIRNKDIIIIDGGGNLGTLWPWEDDKITEIIDTYKNNKILVFPQTCYYDDTEEAKERIKRNREVYQNAKNLMIALRDRASYDFCVNNFENVRFEFIPDIVLSLSEKRNIKRGDKCYLCFREDLEKDVSDSDIAMFRNYLDDNGVMSENISTIKNTNISSKQRNDALNQFWDKLSECRLLLTDRLHGMIFAAITGTPCLALDNKSKKVSGVYEWISDLDYIKVCYSAEEMLENIDKYYKLDSENTDIGLDKFFEILKRVITE